MMVKNQNMPHVRYMIIVQKHDMRHVQNLNNVLNVQSVFNMFMFIPI